MVANVIGNPVLKMSAARVLAIDFRAGPLQLRRQKRGLWTAARGDDPQLPVRRGHRGERGRHEVPPRFLIEETRLIEDHQIRYGPVERILRGGEHLKRGPVTEFDNLRAD